MNYQSDQFIQPPEYDLSFGLIISIFVFMIIVVIGIYLTFYFINKKEEESDDEEEDDEEESDDDDYEEDSDEEEEDSDDELISDELNSIKEILNTDIIKPEKGDLLTEREVEIQRKIKEKNERLKQESELEEKEMREKIRKEAQERVDLYFKNNPGKQLTFNPGR